MRFRRVFRHHVRGTKWRIGLAMSAANFNAAKTGRLTTKAQPPLAPILTPAHVRHQPLLHAKGSDEGNLWSGRHTTEAIRGEPPQIIPASFATRSTPSTSSVRGTYRGTSRIRNSAPLGPYSLTNAYGPMEAPGGGSGSYERGTPAPRIRPTGCTQHVNLRRVREPIRLPPATSRTIFRSIRKGRFHLSGTGLPRS